MAEPTVNELIQEVADSRVDMQALSTFVNADAATQVPRRLAPAIETLEYWRNYMSNLTKGADGVDAAITSMTVTTGAAGTAASVVTGGTPTARTFALTIPRGDKGIDGSFSQKAYTTYAAMDADKVNIPANTSVTVTNDTDTTKNGMYAYSGTAFTKSAYDPLALAKVDATTKANTAKSEAITVAATDATTKANTAKTEAISTAAINADAKIAPISADVKAITDGVDSKALAYTPISGSSIRGFTDPALLSASASSSYLKIDVTNIPYFIISNALSVSQWIWTFTDANDVKLYKSNKVGNGLYSVPPEATYAYRTYKEGATVDSNLVITIPISKLATLPSVASDSDAAKETLFGKLVDLKATSETIADAIAAVNGRVGIDGPYGNNTSLGVKTIKIDVVGVDSLTVKGSLPEPSWKWVFADRNNKIVAVTTTYGDGVYKVPANAVYAYKTVRYSNLMLFENKDVQILGDLVNNDGVLSRFNNLSAVAVTQTKLNTLNLKEEMQRRFEAGETLKLSDFAGVDSEAKIRAALLFIKKRGYGILDLESGTHIVNSAVLLSDNCWLYLNNATLKMADGVFDNIIRNEGINVDTAANGGLATELRENVNIKVFGNSKTASIVSGCDVSYTAPRPDTGGAAVPWTGDDFGWRTIGILLANVKDYELHDFGMRNMQGWAVSQENGCKYFEVHDIEIQSLGVKNGDGINVRMGCAHGEIYNISGYTGDDMVACTAIQNYQNVYPANGNIYSVQVGGYVPLESGGDIKHIRISNVSGGSGHHGVRVLASGGSKAQHISIDNIADATPKVFETAVVLISSGFGEAAQKDDISNITVNKVLANGSYNAVLIRNSLSNSSINFIRQANLNQKLVNVEAATLYDTEVTNVRNL